MENNRTEYFKEYYRRKKQNQEWINKHRKRQREYAKRYYEKMKEDTEWLEKRRKQAREYWQRLKEENPEKWKKVNQERTQKDKAARELYKKVEAKIIHEYKESINQKET